MAEFPIRIPKVAMTITEATLLEHVVGEGATVNEGEPLFLIATDKVETEVASPTSGVVHWKSEPDKTYDVGAQIGFIQTAD
ncbi:MULTISPECIES: lipoyl domain-containing protein [unclassified Pseudofrankia]|uniref:lipoyl domain-containing protein n=1 Tax=unclassified Pseudofrankia TaxID=2994372 RepID=UPI0008DB0E7D|nr:MULTISPECIES: biotin/lipoyl-containing protein [unclassified Pseudofrankia]MDT3442249.1 biotin/lipoyl-containing protein [Pseudofrankia sp. BMG5.37]OHV43545.1 dihydrolipoamide acyltransferase [Pseudofrankia sp. BMG5.36]